MNRRDAREQAFLLVFEKSFNPDALVSEIVDDAVLSREIEIDDFALSLFYGVWENIKNIDRIISDNSIKWNKNRISKTAVSLLRLALYEMIYVDSIPVSVSINEAVELCKKYAGDEDAAFINGILGTVSRKKED